MTLELFPLAGIPEIRPGDDLAASIVAASPPSGTDIVLVAHKVVSKAEGRIRNLGDVEPSERASTLAQEHGKDARFVQVILDESARILRARPGVLICETHHGFVCANAGVDASNVPGGDEVVLLPEDPDGSARTLRARIAELTGARPGVLVTDTFGRAWRLGQTDVAIGAAGVAVIRDWRGRRDHTGRELRVTEIAAADALAGAAELVRAKDSMEPVVLARGIGDLVTSDDGPGAAALRRPPEDDLFR